MQKSLSIRAGITMVMGQDKKTAIHIPDNMTGRKLKSIIKKAPQTLSNARLVLEKVN
jgi:hypothetical protein